MVAGPADRETMPRQALALDSPSEPEVDELSPSARGWGMDDIRPAAGLELGGLPTAGYWASEASGRSSKENKARVENQPSSPMPLPPSPVGTVKSQQGRLGEQEVDRVLKKVWSMSEDDLADLPEDARAAVVKLRTRIRREQQNRKGGSSKRQRDHRQNTEDGTSSDDNGPRRCQDMYSNVVHARRKGVRSYRPHHQEARPRPNVDTSDEGDADEEEKFSMVDALELLSRPSRGLARGSQPQKNSQRSFWGHDA
jgi:hypothetical protein